MTGKKITDYELLDHGMDHAQYFQGCGVSYTEYDECYTGCGSNFSEAIDDCFEQIASSGEYDLADLEQTMLADNDLKAWPTEPNTDEYHEENEDSEMYYYVSIRVK